MDRQTGPVANCEVRIGDTNAFPFANSNRSHGLDQVAQVKILEANQQIQFDWSGNNNNYRAYNNENQQHETQTVPITGKPHITEKCVFLFTKLILTPIENE